MASKSAIFNGIPKIAPNAATNDYKSLENTSKLTITHSVSKKTIPNYTGGGGNDDSFEKLDSVTIAMSARRVSIAAIELAFGGTSEAIASAAVTGEAHTAITLGNEIMLDSMPDNTASLTVTPNGGGTAFVEGTDYTRTRTGFIPLVGGGIAADDVLDVAYTKAKHLRVQALLSTSKERAMLFDGQNERTSKAFIARFHKVNFGVAKSIELIGEDFVSFDIEGEVLAYDLAGVGKSKFYEVLVGDDL